MSKYLAFFILEYTQFQLLVFPGPGLHPQFVFTGPSSELIVLWLKFVITLLVYVLVLVIYLYEL